MSKNADNLSKFMYVMFMSLALAFLGGWVLTDDISFLVRSLVSIMVFVVYVLINLLYDLSVIVHAHARLKEWEADKEFAGVRENG